MRAGVVLEGKQPPGAMSTLVWACWTDENGSTLPASIATLRPARNSGVLPSVAMPLADFLSQTDHTRGVPSKETPDRNGARNRYERNRHLQWTIDVIVG